MEGKSEPVKLDSEVHGGLYPGEVDTSEGDPENLPMGVQTAGVAGCSHLCLPYNLLFSLLCFKNSRDSDIGHTKHQREPKVAFAGFVLRAGKRKSLSPLTVECEIWTSSSYFVNMKEQASEKGDHRQKGGPTFV